MTADTKEYYHNKTQKKVITGILDISLHNNDLYIKDKIINYLENKCEKCQTYILNPEPIDNKVICSRCINYYVICAHSKCSKLKHIRYWSNRCERCYAWRCEEHKKPICPCREKK